MALVDVSITTFLKTSKFVNSQIVHGDGAHDSVYKKGRDSEDAIKAYKAL